MNAYKIAEAFRAAFAADVAFTGAHCEHEQTGNADKRPSLIFACKTIPMNMSAKALRFELTVTAAGNADRKVTTDPDPAVAHAALAERVSAKLLGTGKSALLVALNTPAVFSFRGWSPAECDLAIADRQFETPISISGPVLVL